MSLSKLLDAAMLVSIPPPGSVNVLVGNSVEGPGGKWVPCATVIACDTYVSCLFEVGPGRRQVCVADRPLPCAEDALAQAIELAATAAA